MALERVETMMSDRGTRMSRWKRFRHAPQTSSLCSLLPLQTSDSMLRLSTMFEAHEIVLEGLTAVRRVRVIWLDGDRVGFARPWTVKALVSWHHGILEGGASLRTTVDTNRFAK